MAPPPDTTRRAVELVSELVRIPSVNPLHAGPRSGEGGEQAMSAWLANRADAMGATVVVDEVVDGRSNVYARFAGTTDRTVTVDVHLDTVGVEHMTRDPFDGAVEDGRVFGRGSVDTKATLGVVLAVLEELLETGSPGPTVNVVGTVAEEVGGLLGAVRHAAWLRSGSGPIDQLIVAEPTGCAPVFGHKGGVGLDITVHGHAAHSSTPRVGCNAIAAAGRIIGALGEEHDRLDAEGSATEVGPGTIAVTLIEGGRARNIIPDRCSVFADRRVSPGEDPEVVFRDLTRMIEDAASPADVDVVTPYGEGFPAFYQSPDSELISRFSDLAREEPTTATFGSNALKYGDIAHEVMVFGPGSIEQAHQAVEWVTIDELARAVAIYRSFLGPA